MDKTRIDGQKMDMHPRRVAAWLDAKDNWEKAKRVYPIYVEISPYGVCNHECTFCSVDYMLDRTDHPRIPYEVMTRMLTDMAARGVKSAMFAGAGEPLLYKDPSVGKDLADVILYADEVGIDTAITTNTVRMTPAFCEKAFVAQGLKWTRTSINGGDRDTYARIHRTKPEDFDTVLKNLENAVKIRTRLKAPVRILTQIVVVPEGRGTRRRVLTPENYPSNLSTVVALAKRLRDIGVDNLAIKPYKQHTVELGVTRSHMYHGTSYADAEMQAVFQEAAALETDAFEVTVRDQAMAQQDAEWRGYNTCYSTPYFWAYVEADGEVWGCSAHVGRIENGREIGDHRFRFGNVNEQSFTDIWHGERRKACWEYTRKPPSQGGLDCAKCMKGCQMDMPNVWLWSLMNPEPTRNFVK